MRVLVAEDDRPVASFLAKGLSAEHYVVDIASDGEEALFLAEHYDYDLLVLDLNLPKVDGFSVLQRIRAKKPHLGVLVLTGKTEIGDRIRGLDFGADDYLTKPFSLAELLARVRAVLRRSARPYEAVLQVDDLTLDRLHRTVTRAGRRIELTPKEFALLEYLMQNANRPVSRAQIIEHVWNLCFDSSTNVVDVYINYLRKKIDEGFDRRLIHTIRGVGYQLGLPDTARDENKAI